MTDYPLTITLAMLAIVADVNLAWFVRLSQSLLKLMDVL